MTEKRTMPVVDQKWDIIGPEPETVFADGITELRIVDGVVYVSLCQHSMDVDNAGQVRVATRLRMSTVVANMLASNIMSATEKAAKQAEEIKRTAN